ncbi:MAG: 50S ribosomal protein L23 [Elusimicrobiota bacterium]
MTTDNTLYNVLKSPVVTEKSTRERMNFNKYTFFVDLNANKRKIKKAVEEIFEVTVKSVNTQHVRGKEKRMGRYEGKSSKRKKAVVTLEEGDRIQLMEGP